MKHYFATNINLNFLWTVPATEYLKWFRVLKEFAIPVRTVIQFIANTYEFRI